MAEEDEDLTEGNEGGAKKGSKNKLFAIIGLLVVLGAGGGYYFMTKGDGDAGGDDESSAQEDDGGGEGGAEGLSTVVNLEPFVVNLIDNAGTRYLKVTVNLEVSSSKVTAEIEAIKPRVRDAIIVLLSSKSYEDIGSIQGKYQLRDEVATRVNQFLKKGSVNSVYFTEFVIQ